MPFVKTGRNSYQSPSGRTFTRKQVAAYYAGGGHFPGSGGMKDQFPKSHFSPTALGAAAKPSFVNSGAVNAATSPTPTTILAGSKQTFGPLEYSRRDGDQEYWSPDRIADRERRRASNEFNSMRPKEAPKTRRK